MPKFAHCFFDNVHCRIGAVELDCEKATSLLSVEMSLLAKSVSIIVLDQQITDVLKIFEKNPQLKSKITIAEKRLGDKILISNIWI
jgi:hypothetical protein